MPINEKTMIAYCGLNCKTCDAYIATVTDNQALREQTARLWSKLNDTNILPEQINCEGCRTKGKKTIYCESICAIRQCAKERSMASCGDCPSMKFCLKVGEIIDNNPIARSNLEKKLYSTRSRLAQWSTVKK